MSQDYTHARERAELLGLPIPSEEEWKESQKAEAENRSGDDNVIQDLDHSNEAAQRIGGGLDELNSILSATQKKINRFKTVCGSLSTLLKVKVGSRGSTPDHKSVINRDHSVEKNSQETPTTEENIAVELPTDESQAPKNSENGSESNPAKPTKIDINEKMGSHIDKLDSLVTKAENAQYSMQHQTKQMKKFLK